MRRVISVITTCAVMSIVLVGGAPVSRAAGGHAPLLTCSTPLTLRNGANQTGTSATVSTRGVWINLSTVSFNNMTSSFTVGACSVSLASATNGGGAHYTRCLSAGCVENTMDLGWDNVISSVYLH